MMTVTNQEGMFGLIKSTCLLCGPRNHPNALYKPNAKHGRHQFSMPSNSGAGNNNLFTAGCSPKNQAQTTSRIDKKQQRVVLC